MYTATGDKGIVESREIRRLLMKENVKQTFLRVFKVFLLILLDVPCWTWDPGSLTAVTSHHSGGFVAWGWQPFSQIFQRKTSFMQFISIRTFKYETIFFWGWLCKWILWKSPPLEIQVQIVQCKYNFTEFCLRCVLRCGLNAPSKLGKHATDYSITYIPTIT